MSQSATLTLLLALLLGLIVLAVLGRALLLPAWRRRRAARARLARLVSRHGRTAARPDQVRTIRRSGPEAGGGSGLAGALARWLPHRRQQRARLDRAGLHLSVGRYMQGVGGLFLGLLLVLLLIGLPGMLALSVALLGGIGLPHLALGWLARRRRARLANQFPDAIELIVRGLKSGLPVNEGLANVAAEIGDPLAGEFRAIRDSMALGNTLEQALWAAAERVDLADFRFFVIAVVVQRETGGNLAETLANLATIVRQRRSMKLKIRAMASEAKASAAIVGALPFIMLALILMLNPGYGMVLFTDPRGVVAAVGGLIWMILGVLVMRKMIAFEQ
ncbi:type II secretion system F family protein [Yunchengibacter salinarum]|uniref:type II secretion system F family protein n=1 Tax=Yunchengibacter salinarum TaxID=3133399 RepID=UPI0035B659B4